MNSKILLFAVAIACIVLVSADPLPRKQVFDLVGDLNKPINRAKDTKADDDCSATEEPGVTCKPDHNCVAVPDAPEGECPDDTHDPCIEAVYLPHKDNCQYFYQCVHRKPVQMCCPEGTCYNPLLKVCA